MILYLSLEIIGFTLYVMIGMENKYIFSIEASLKYFIFNAIASGFFLFLLKDYINQQIKKYLPSYSW